jgi:AcrR family transcriptional regulator
MTVHPSDHQAQMSMTGERWRVAACDHLAVVSSTPYPVAARELLRNSLLDAAVGQLELRPWAQVTMGDIAVAAGVSRQTLYKEFGSRAMFVQELVLREVDRFIAPLAQPIAAHALQPSAAITEALQAFLLAAAAHPLVHTIISGEGTDEFLRLFTTRGSPVLRRAVGRLAEILHDNWPQVDRGEIDVFAECMVRLAVSLAALPDSPAGLNGEVISNLFTPYIESILAKAMSEA